MKITLAPAFLAIASAAFTNAVQTCVNGGGIPGECISTTSCSSSGGSSQAGYCPGSASIQCCTYPTCTSGRCLPTLGCSGTSVSGLCPGPSEIQCCQNAPATISGLNALQSAHAYQIARAVRDKVGTSRQACLAAISTALVESNLKNYASDVVSSSYNYQYDAVGSDYDSVGVFQQRVKYYPNVAADMDPYRAAGQFLDKMVTISGWQTMDVGTLDQKIQVSAYPDRYNERVPQAQTICSAMGF